MQKSNLLLAVCAGLVGGIVSHYAWTDAAQAQSFPSQVQAQRFILLDAQGIPAGMFAVGKADNPNAPPRIVLYDAKGREIWHAGSVRPEPLNPYE